MRFEKVNAIRINQNLEITKDKDKNKDIIPSLQNPALASFYSICHLIHIEIGTSSNYFFALQTSVQIYFV